ncbi:MAG: aminoacetone oxidase family FAD-binding enzyme [Clostridia bacterium]|nr:aminoacetone oxidase family FAD-binding enzyme [Clostridia bacterium]
MERFTTAIIGGGASGLILASSLENNEKTVLLERGERVGKKLSSTGNGQGNITNLSVLEAEYFSQTQNSEEKIKKILSAYDNKSLIETLKGLGVLTIADERGRVYPASRQASALTDALRFYVAQKGVDVRLCSKVTSIEKTAQGFVITVETPEGSQRLSAENVALCAGGKAAKNFGTDGNGYALAQLLGHTVTPLYPSLVQLKTDTAHIKTLKGIRVNNGGLTATWRTKTGEKRISLQGDVIFTEYGISGDAVFRISAFITGEIAKTDVTVTLDFLPDHTEEEIYQTLLQKRQTFPDQSIGELLCGIVNNQIGRAIFKRAENDLRKGAALTKRFSLNVTGSLGFDYAQVTKGGVPLNETDGDLQSVSQTGLYFAGELLDVDGQCGGFNLQWAYSSARTVAAAIDERTRAQSKKR